ncbi:hypothetical protein ACFYNO_01450 [Kitasatospora sp. NPDC006697]|uniref:hypothetical protein n=1 Tax=Kitasatospora sp. NPDC006697 TaxID=3364020 RepID=UPI00367D67DC
MSHDEDYEEEFGAALREAADHSPEPLVELLAAGAARRGRAAKRRRTLLTATAAVVVLAGAGTLAVQLQPAHKNGTAEQSVAAAAPGSSTPLPSGKPTAPVPPPSAGALAGTPSPSAGAGRPMTDEQMTALLQQKLPGFKLSRPFGHGTEPAPGQRGPGAYAGFTITDANGEGGVEIVVNHSKPAVPVAGNRCPGKADCTATTLPDGSVLTVNLPPMTSFGLQNWEVTLQNPNGVMVMAESGNVGTPGVAGMQPTGKATPLSGDQLKALAMDPDWQDIGLAVPIPGNPPGAPVPSTSPSAAG